MAAASSAAASSAASSARWQYNYVSAWQDFDASAQALLRQLEFAPDINAVTIPSHGKQFHGCPWKRVMTCTSVQWQVNRDGGMGVSWYDYRESDAIEREFQRQHQQNDFVLYQHVDKDYHGNDVPVTLFFIEEGGTQLEGNFPIRRVSNAHDVAIRKGPLPGEPRNYKTSEDLVLPCHITKHIDNPPASDVDIEFGTETYTIKPSGDLFANGKQLHLTLIDESCAQLDEMINKPYRWEIKGPLRVDFMRNKASAFGIGIQDDDGPRVGGLAFYPSFREPHPDPMETFLGNIGARLKPSMDKQTREYIIKDEERKTMNNALQYTTDSGGYNMYGPLTFSQWLLQQDDSATSEEELQQVWSTSNWVPLDPFCSAMLPELSGSNAPIIPLKYKNNRYVICQLMNEASIFGASYCLLRVQHFQHLQSLAGPFSSVEEGGMASWIEKTYPEFIQCVVRFTKNPDYKPQRVAFNERALQSDVNDIVNFVIRTAATEWSSGYKTGDCEICGDCCVLLTHDACISKICLQCRAKNLYERRLKSQPPLCAMCRGVVNTLRVCTDPEPCDEDDDEDDDASGGAAAASAAGSSTPSYVLTPAVLAKVREALKDKKPDETKSLMSWFRLFLTKGLMKMRPPPRNRQQKMSLEDAIKEFRLE